MYSIIAHLQLCRDLDSKYLDCRHHSVMGDADFEEIVMEWSRRHGVFSAWFKNLRGKQFPVSANSHWFKQ